MSCLNNLALSPCQFPPSRQGFRLSLGLCQKHRLRRHSSESCRDVCLRRRQITAAVRNAQIMGVVYRAQDPRLKRQVAIKLLPPDLTRDETAKQRFLQEAQAASALDHPNICTIYEINETPDGRLYLVMAYYEGETLKQRIQRGPLAIDDAIDSSMLGVTS